MSKFLKIESLAFIDNDTALKDSKCHPKPRHNQTLKMFFADKAIITHSQMSILAMD